MPGPFPLATLAPTISAAGIQAVTLSDILQDRLATYSGIFGSDVVQDASTQDIQQISANSKAIYDCGQAIVSIYNSFRPGQAVGSGLSSIVKINGLARLVASNSTAPVQIVGRAGTIITNGIVGDGTYQWALPASVTIPTGGSITVTVTCTTIGAISAPAGTINQIITPQRGWQTAVSTADAAIGAPVETDAALTARQATSTSLPAQTPLEAIVGNLANLAGVTMIKPYENDTNTTDGNGLPPHSIALVVEGGNAVSVATIIAQKKAPGTGTFGTTSEVIVDSLGVPNTINFFIPTQVPIDVTITITPYSGYVSTTGILIVTQEAAYLNQIGIGGTNGFVFNNKLYSPANDTGSVQNTYNVSSITFRRGTNAYATTDIPIAFNELPVAGNVQIVVT